jgi:hypothetical protein
MAEILALSVRCGAPVAAPQSLVVSSDADAPSFPSGENAMALLDPHDP